MKQSYYISSDIDNMRKRADLIKEIRNADIRFYEDELKRKENMKADLSEQMRKLQREYMESNTKMKSNKDDQFKSLRTISIVGEELINQVYLS